MSDHRTVDTVVTVDPQPGTGILHPFPTDELAHLDPFVFLDTGAPVNLGDGDIYVGPHPHRGVQPVSLLFRGRIEHRDSLGNHRTITSGGMQWLVAGSGALHEEVLHGDDDGVFHMAQLWVNLPAARKLEPAEHHAEPAGSVPELRTLGRNSLVRLFAGTVGGHVGPAPLPTPVTVAHAILGPDGDVTIPVEPDWTAAYCVVAGDVDGDGVPGRPGTTVVFARDGDAVSASSATGGELLVMAGQPIGEPIAMGGGFVMNTRVEITHAFEDYHAGRMGSLEPSR